MIVLRGAGRAFCAGYDFGGGFEHWGDAMSTDGEWDPGKDFAMATAPQLAPTQKLMSVWRTPKPVIAQVRRPVRPARGDGRRARRRPARSSTA